MSYRKWLIATLSLFLIFAALIVAVNFYVDHHAIRMSLFSGRGVIQQSIYPHGINQHIFNPEFIFRSPERFHSFLFGSSRIATVRVEKIPGGGFFNMSYSSGLPVQHLEILKAFLKKGVRIQAVVVGLDEFCFNLPDESNQKHLLRIMHPEAGGPGYLKLFGMYFFRKPGLKELSLWKDRVILRQTKGLFILDEQGVNLGWQEKDQIIEKAGRPIFDFVVHKYEPIAYDPRKLDEAFTTIEAIIDLSKSHGFSLTFFITPIYHQLYLNNAEALLQAKLRLAGITDFYDFSGFNSITTDAMNYYEESHYRYLVGDMILARIFGIDDIRLPENFGSLVTRENIGGHILNQKRELDQYLRKNHLK